MKKRSQRKQKKISYIPSPIFPSWFTLLDLIYSLPLSHYPTNCIHTLNAYVFLQKIILLKWNQRFHKIILSPREFNRSLVHLCCLTFYVGFPFSCNILWSSNDSAKSSLIILLFLQTDHEWKPVFIPVFRIKFCLKVFVLYHYQPLQAMTLNE